MEKETIIGIEALKDKFRWAKLMVGDLRGLKNRFALGERLGVSGLQTFFHAVGGNGEYRMEVYVDIMPKGTTNSFWCYSIKDMVEEIMDSKETEFEVEFHYCKWNKARTDADRIRITMPILFKKNNIMKGNINEEHLQEARKIIGDWLRGLREKKGLTQEQLGEQMQVKRSTIAKIETGKWNFSIDYLILFAEYLDFIPMFIQYEHNTPLLLAMEHCKNVELGKEKGM